MSYEFLAESFYFGYIGYSGYNNLKPITKQLNH